MHRQIRRTRAIANAVDATHLTPNTLSAEPLSAFAKSRRKERRSAALVAAVQRIDAATDEATKREIMEWLVDQYNQRQGGNLIGLMAECFLGHPYVDHRMDLTGNIVEHHDASTTVPEPFNQGRTLARSQRYAYIEIYADGQIVPIRPDGTPAI